MITGRRLTNLVLNGLKTHTRNRLEDYKFISTNQVLQKVLAQKRRGKQLKEIRRSKSNSSKMHMV